MTDLFSPMRLGALDLPNRIWMSAMTRTRATADNVPTELMAEYFAQRADAGLIVTDCTAVSSQARGVIRGPGIWREDQIAGWRLVTDRVHEASGRIFCQLWHCGRVAHPDMRDGDMPLAPSATPATGDFFLPSGKVDFPVPRELHIDELPGIVADFAQATRNARAAGFDGVELHGANGYLHDQFLQDGANKRTDAYGGSAENRARRMLETTRAMIDVWDAGHVGVRLSPSSYLYGVDDSDKHGSFGTVIGQLDALGIAYLTLLAPALPFPTHGDHNMTRILFVGQKPETVDFSDPALPPGFDAEKIKAGIAIAVEKIKERGWDGETCMITPDDAGRAMLEAALRNQHYDCVVIGGGLRIPPKSLALFEAIVNIVHKAAPGAAIAFNTQPQDTAEAAARQLVL